MAGMHDINICSFQGTKIGDEWKMTTYAEYYQETRAAAKSFIKVP